MLMLELLNPNYHACFNSICYDGAVRSFHQDLMDESLLHCPSYIYVGFLWSVQMCVSAHYFFLFSAWWGLCFRGSATSSGKIFQEYFL